MSLQSAECTALSAEKNLKFIEENFSTTSTRKADQVDIWSLLGESVADYPAMYFLCFFYVNKSNPNKKV